MAEQEDKYSDNDRYELSSEIISISPRLDEIYDKIRVFENTGDLPAIIEVDVKQKVIKMMNRKGTLNSRISRINTMLKGQLEPKERMKLEKELTAKKIELNEIKEYLSI